MVKWPKSSRFQFSLLTLLLVVTACCVTLAWWSNRAHRQARAVAWVREQGGFVLYHWEFHVEGEPPELNRFVEWIGVDYFHTVMTVRLEGEQVDDLSPLTDITNVDIVILRGMRINDLSPLVDLKSLHSIILIDSQVSDPSPLAELTSLQSLSLEETPVSDEDVETLKRALPNLRIHR